MPSTTGQCVPRPGLAGSDGRSRRKVSRSTQEVYVAAIGRLDEGVFAGAEERRLE